MLAGTSFILMERATHALAPIDVGIGRLTVGAAVLSAVWFAQRAAHRVSWGDVVRIASVALISTALPFVVQPYCLSRGFGHSFFGMLVGLVPIATIIVSIPMLDVWPSTRQILGVVGGFLCMMLLLEDGAERGMSTWLMALGLTVPLCYAIGNTYLKRKLSHVHAVPLTTLVLSTSAAWLIVLRFTPGMIERFGLYVPTQPHDWRTSIAALLVLGTMGTGVAVLLFNYLVVKEGPLFAGMATYVVPMMALVWGAIDGEPITPRQLGAMLGVLSMVALVQFGGSGKYLDQECADTNIP